MYLNNHSYYSLKYGTLSENQLIELLSKSCQQVYVLTDINNTSGCLNFVRLLHKQNKKAVLGIDFRNGNTQQYVGIARNNEGFEQLNRFLSRHLIEKSDFPDRAPNLDNVFFVYSFERAVALDLIRFRESEYLGISIATLRKLPFSKYRDYKEKLVVMQTVSYASRLEFNMHRLLRSMDLNIMLSQLSIEGHGTVNEIFVPYDQLLQAYSQYDHILENTSRLLMGCDIDFGFKAIQQNGNLKCLGNNPDEDYRKLLELASAGIPYRYPDLKTRADQQDIYDRIEMEASMVHEKGFVSYFLINYEICEYARNMGYFYVGRGSGANSILAYLLQITDVDPIELDLYFERFFNNYRTSPPDFDIDFSWDDRNDVTRFMFERFGTRDNVALLGTYNTFQYRAVVRELGKVFGMPTDEIDVLTTGYTAFNPNNKIHQLIKKYAQLITDLPNYVSIHAGGILITDQPIFYYSAVNMPPKGFPTVQFDMHIAEDAGIYKFDILAQRGLGKIRDAVQVVRENQPQAVIADVRRDVKIFMRDDKINRMISRAGCLGCFYIESPAMRMLLSKLATNSYLELVAASSVIRPGVAQSGMMREFILRTRFPEKRAEAHPILNEIMPETYGIMVYQEDVIKVAHKYANLSLVEADVLRRGMSGKYRSRDEFKRVEDNFFNNCKEIGRDLKEAQEIWKQIQSFAGYAFAKGHSASYAVESYQSLYLKCYFPLEYMVATINNGGGFYRPEIYIHEARMLGATIEPPCVNKSHIGAHIEGTTIYLGFSQLKGMEKNTMVKIMEARAYEGPFNSLEDYLERVYVGVEQSAILGSIDAFRFSGRDRFNILWDIYIKMGLSKVRYTQQRLFRPEHKKVKVPRLNTTPQELAFNQMDLMGFPLCSHFELLGEPPLNKNTRKDFPDFLGKNIFIYGYVVNIKTTYTKNNKRMQFGTFLDQDGSFFDTVMFPQIASKIVYDGGGVYMIYGKVVEEFDFCSIEVIKMEKAPYMPDPRYDDDDPQTIQRMRKLKSLQDRRLGNSNGHRKIELPVEKVDIHQPG
ncbi:MAG: PHP domain-containing protein [Nonlabens sp.]